MYISRIYVLGIHTDKLGFTFALFHFDKNTTLWWVNGMGSSLFNSIFFIIQYYLLHYSIAPSSLFNSIFFIIQ